MKNFIFKTLCLFMIPLFSSAQVQRTISYLSTELKYSVVNNSQINTLFLIHGLGDNSNSFNLINDDLSKLPFKIVTFDLPGCGVNKDSQLFFPDYSGLLNRLVKDEHNDLGKTFVIGHSFGGLISLLAKVESSLDYDVIVIEASITDADKEFFKLVQEPPIGIGLDELKTTRPNDVGYTVVYKENLRSSDPIVLKENIKTVFDNWEELQNRILASKTPFTYCYGKKSSQPTVRQSLDKYSFIKVVSFEDANHWVHRDQPQAFLEFIQAHIK